MRSIVEYSTACIANNIIEHSLTFIIAHKQMMKLKLILNYFICQKKSSQMQNSITL